MPLGERTHLQRSSQRTLDLPPPFKLVTLREVGDAFAHAASVASEVITSNFSEVVKTKCRASS